MGTEHASARHAQGHNRTTSRLRNSQCPLVETVSDECVDSTLHCSPPSPHQKPDLLSQTKLCWHFTAPASTYLRTQSTQSECSPTCPRNRFRQASTIPALTPFLALEGPPPPQKSPSQANVIFCRPCRHHHSRFSLVPLLVTLLMSSSDTRFPFSRKRQMT
jgi:hypothetical protein